MNCPDCGSEAILVDSSNAREEYFCKECKIYFSVEVDMDTKELDELEFDDDWESDSDD